MRAGMIRYGSVCSGIEAATVAWHPLGWQPSFFAEIEKFPSAVLAHRHDAIPNLGDITAYQDWPDAAIDLLVGGTPCQSFSVAGLRKGLADPRGNLALTYLGIVDRYRPTWCVWENVPGVLSLDKGRAFGSIIGGLAELGYGWSYRVLDAQFVRVDGLGRAVPQRRRRVFLVGNSGSWRRAAAVLFEPESLSWNTAPRRQAGQGVAPTISARPTGGGGLGTDFDLDGGLIAADVAPTLNAHFGDKQGLENQHIDGGCGMFVAHSLRAEGFDASEDGTGRGTPLVPIAFSACDYGNDAQHNFTPTLRVGSGSGKMGGGQQMAVAFNMHKSGNEASSLGVAVKHTDYLRAFDKSPFAVHQPGLAVRRLTPTECERLQGFPDGYTAIPHRGKPAADGPRYKALGNSMAVNVMRWIGRRIEMVDAICAEQDRRAA